MSINLIRGKINTFQVSVGEEGAVIIYIKSGKIHEKMFIRTTQDIDTAKLKELLIEDPLARISIYLDNLDQSYVQRTLPAVNALGINSLAQKRLDKEIPDGHLKTFVQIGRLPSGRNDWIYSFVSAGYESPVSDWIDFFIPFKNIISGIYFLPIEIHAIVAKLKNIALKENQFQQKNKTSKIQEFFSGFSSNNHAGIRRWEVYLSQNKTGGFRQVAYQDGKIIFSRLLNNIGASTSDVVAGNIEQEVANSIEYMSRLSLGSDQEIDVYLILSSDILRFIRKDKIKATNLITYSPFELAKTLNVSQAAGEKDKFVDPTLLTALSREPTKIKTLHTDVTGKVSKIVYGIDCLALIMFFLIPALLFASIYITAGISDLRSSINIAKMQSKQFDSELKKHEIKIDESKKSIEENIPIDHLIETVKNYQFFNSTDITPFEFIEKISAILPEYAKVKVFKWVYDEPRLFNASVPNSINSLNEKRDYKFVIDIEVSVSKEGSSFEEIEMRYNNFVELFRNAFDKYDVAVSDMPQIFSFNEEDLDPNMVLNVKISYPKTSVSNSKRRFSGPLNDLGILNFKTAKNLWIRGHYAG